MDRLLAAAIIVPGLVFLGLGMTQTPATHGFAYWGVMYGLLVLAMRVGLWLTRPGLLRLVAALVPTLGVFAMIAGFSFLAVDPLIIAALVAVALLLTLLARRDRSDRTRSWVCVGIAATTLASGLVA